MPGTLLTFTLKAIDKQEAAAENSVEIFVSVVAPFTIDPLVLAGAPGTTVLGRVIVRRTGGFVGPVKLAIAGLPPSWSPTRFPPGALAAGLDSVEIDVPATALAVPQGATITGTNAGTAITMSAALTVNVSTGKSPDFSLSTTPSSLSVTQGQSATTTISIAPTAAGLGAVALSLKPAEAGEVVPADVIPTFQAVTATASMLTLSVGSTVTPGVYPLLVEGSAGTLIRSTPLTLTVEVAPDFALAVVPDAITLTAGTQGAATLTVARIGAVGPVDLDYSGNPSGMTIAFASDPLTGPSTGVTIQTTVLTPPRTHVVTLRGTAAGLTRTTTLTVTVNSPPPPANNFGVQLALDSVTMAPGTMVTVPVHLPRTGQLVGGSVILTSLFTQTLGSTWIAPNISRDPTATLQVAVASGINPGEYRAIVTGAFNSGALIRADTLVVRVAPSTVQDFSLVPANTYQVVLTRGSTSTTMGLAIQRTNGFAGSISFSSPDADPATMGVTFAPQVVNGTSNQSTVVLFYAAPNAVPGIYTLTLRGVSGALTRDAVITVVIN